MFEPSVDDASVPKPERVDHVAEDEDFDVVFLRRLILLHGDSRPLDNSIHYFTGSHLLGPLRTSIDYSLLESSRKGSSLAELFDRIQHVYLHLYLLGRRVLVVVLCYHFFCFLEVVQLKIGLLIFSLVQGDSWKQLAGLFDVQRVQSGKQSTIDCELSIFILENSNFFGNGTKMVAVEERTHLILLSFQYKHFDSRGRVRAVLLAFVSLHDCQLLINQGL